MIYHNMRRMLCMMCGAIFILNHFHFFFLLLLFASSCEIHSTHFNPFEKFQLNFETLLYIMAMDECVLMTTSLLKHFKHSSSSSSQRLYFSFCSLARSLSISSSIRIIISHTKLSFSLDAGIASIPHSIFHIHFICFNKNIFVESFIILLSYTCINTLIHTVHDSFHDFSTTPHKTMNKWTR